MYSEDPQIGSTKELAVAGKYSRSPIPESLHLEGGEIKSPDTEGLRNSYAIYNC